MNPKKPRPPCLVCGTEPEGVGYKYCSNACQHEYQYREYIKRWRMGQEIGLSNIGTVTFPIKRFLREKFGNKCALCGWSVINSKTKKVPLVADHIDGNWKNNLEINLRLICPNCDAISPTFAGLNRGNGRRNRNVSKRVLEAQALKGLV